MKTKNESSDNVGLHRQRLQLITKATNAKTLAKAARRHWRTLKVEERQAHKAFKQAKKAARRAQREARVAMKALKKQGRR